MCNKENRACLFFLLQTHCLQYTCSSPIFFPKLCCHGERSLHPHGHCMCECLKPLLSFTFVFLAVPRLSPSDIFLFSGGWLKKNILHGHTRCAQWVEVMILHLLLRNPFESIQNVLVKNHYCADCFGHITLRIVSSVFHIKSRFSGHIFQIISMLDRKSYQNKTDL